MRDLGDRRWMYAKAAMLVVIGMMSFGLLIAVPMATWQRVVLQATMVWAFCRAYYFAFYVVQHYVDDKYRFSGLLQFFEFLVGPKRQRRGGDPAA